MGSRLTQPPAFQRPSGYLYNTTLQENLVNGISTKVVLDHKNTDFTDNTEDVVNYRITPGVAGFYSIGANLTFNNVVANKHYEGCIKINEVELGGSRVVVHSSLAEEVTVVISLPSIYLSADEFVELYAISNSGDNTVDIKLIVTTLCVQRVR